MKKENSLNYVSLFQSFIKYLIYGTVFLIPLFFLPFTTDAFDYNKQSILVILAFFATLFWILKSLVSKKMEIKTNYVILAIALFCLSYLFSVFFSSNPQGSFWGWPLPISESFLSILSLSLIYFLVLNAFSEKEIFNISMLLSASVVVGQIFALITLFFPSIFSGYFNTIGSSGSLGILSAVLLPILIVFFISSKKLYKLFFGIGIAVSFIIFVILNYNIVWGNVALGCFTLILIAIIKKDFFDLRWMSLPIFFLVISIFFLFLKPQVQWLPNVGDEIFLNQQESANIAGNVLKQNLLFGSGPGTFSYDYLQYKDKSISSSVVWNLVFDKASSKALTLLATTGIIGTLLFFAIMILAVFYSVKYLFFKKIQDSKKWIFIAGIFSALSALLLSYFLYHPNLALDFTYFILLALISNIIFNNSKEFILKPNSLATLVLVFVFIVVLIFGIGILVVGGQRYYAEINYYNGLKSLSAGNLDQAIISIERSIQNNTSSDLYFSQLAQLYILKMQNDLANENLTEDKKAERLQILGSNAINASIIATNLNPRSSQNWSVRGFVYQNLSGGSEEALSLAEQSYKQALSLDPNNPYLFTRLGSLYYQKEDYNNAITELSMAIELNYNYSPALYYLGLAYDKKGNKSEAEKQFSRLVQLNPQNQEIKKILDNVRAGRSALSGIIHEEIKEVIKDKEQTIEIPENSAP